MKEMANAHDLEKLQMEEEMKKLRDEVSVLGRVGERKE